MVAVLAGYPVREQGGGEAERWADVADHWQYGEASRPE